MSETKPGMSSWTEEDIRRIVDERYSLIVSMISAHESSLTTIASNIQKLIKVTTGIVDYLDPPPDTNEDQAECNDTQEVSVKDSVTAD